MPSNRGGLEKLRALKIGEIGNTILKIVSKTVSGNQRFIQFPFLKYPMSSK